MTHLGQPYLVSIEMSTRIYGQYINFYYEEIIKILQTGSSNSRTIALAHPALGHPALLFNF